MAAASSLIIKASSSSFLVNRGDSKPWRRRNPLLRTRTTTQIYLPSSMISSSGSAPLRVQCVVMNNNSSSSTSTKKNCCFKKEEEEQVKEEEEEEGNPKQIQFGVIGELILKALTTPLISTILVGILLKNYPALASSRTQIFFGVMLACDLCRVIVSKTRVDNDDGGSSYIRYSIGPALGSIVLFLTAVCVMMFGVPAGLESETSSEGSENNSNITNSQTKIGIMAMMFMMVFVFGTSVWPIMDESSTV